MAGDKQVGTTGSHAGSAGLAMLRLDRVADARAAGTPLIAGGVRDRTAQARLGDVRLAGGERSDDRRHSCTPTDNAPLPVARSRTIRSTSPITTTNGACRNTTTARSTRSSCSTASRPGCRGSRSCASATTSAALSMASEPEKIARYDARKKAKLMQDAGIVRNRLKIEGAVLSARAYLEIMEKGPGFSALPVGLSRRQAEGQQVPRHQAGAGGNRAVAEDVQGVVGARLQVRRADHRLCLHAGGRHGQRPSGEVPLPRSRAQATAGANSRQRASDAARADRAHSRLPRLAAHAVGPAARPARPLAARHRDRGYRARARARRALERPDRGRAHLFGRAAHAAGRCRGAGALAEPRPQGAAR